MDENAILEENYRSFIKAPAGVDLMNYLKEQIEIDMDSAVNEIEPIKAVSLLQRVNAYRIIVSYIERRSTIDNP